ncbi:SRPBCC family protein [Phytomonospora sp. NPDC050363]|uniref:SRPBCC family protein n=1 Tax=Phytomonospora sp. NPDC050363 TaxID=3155642 RepID=UPI0033D6C7F9
MNETFTIIDGRGVLSTERRLPQPVEAVWRVLTETESLDEWFPAHVEAEPAVDGAITFVFPGEEGPPLTGRVTAYEQPHRFAYTWGDDHLEWTAEPDGGGTRLTLKHTFDDIAGAASFAAGWETCLDAAAQVLDGVGVVVDAGASAAAHERFVELFGLDEGTIERDGEQWRVRFERQLRAGLEELWEHLGGPGFADAGGEVPEGFTVAGFPPGPVSAVEAPFFLTYHWLSADGEPAGDVRLEFAPGPGGARLLLTHTGTGERAEAALAAWHDRIAELGAEAAALSK